MPILNFNRQVLAEMPDDANYHLVNSSLPSNSLHNRVCFSMDMLARMFLVTWTSRRRDPDTALLEAVELESNP